jgi:hypothetical protein
MSTIQFTSENIDVRDINPGEVYYAIASKDKGGRCVNNGCFTAAWRSKADAKTAANGNPDYTVVKCLKPEGAAY